MSSDPAIKPGASNGHHHRPHPHPRLSATDWEHAALDMIAEGGIAGLAIETLARRIDVTKGSFYWHFKNRDALVSAALARWEADDTQELASHLGDTGDEPRARLGALFRWVSGEMRPHRIYAALLQALDHPLVKPVMTRVSQRRMDLLEVAFHDAGLAPEAARHRARLTYAAYVGFVQLNLALELPHLSHEQYDAYVEHVIDALVPDGH